MPVRPIRATENEGPALRHRAWTSTPNPSSSKDLRPTSKFVAGIPQIPELESPGIGNIPTSNKLPRMDDNSSKKPTYILMVREAIKSTGDVRKGASVQTIKKFLIGHYGCEDGSRLNNNIKKALLKGIDSEIFRRPKNSTETGIRGFFVLNKIKREPEKVKANKEDEEVSSKPDKKVGKEVPEPMKEKKNKKPTPKAVGPSAKVKPEKIPKAKAKKVNKKESPAAEKKAKPKISKKTAETAHQKTKARKPKQNVTDRDKTLVADSTKAVPADNKNRRHQRKLSSAASDTEVTLVRPNLTEIVVSRINFSDQDISMIAKAELGRSIKTTESSVKLKAKDTKAKQKRLSLKTSKLLRKRGNPRASMVRDMRRSSRNKNAVEETSVKALAKPKDTSADSIIMKPKRLVPRRKSSV